MTRAWLVLVLACGSPERAPTTHAAVATSSSAAVPGEEPVAVAAVDSGPDAWTDVSPMDASSSAAALDAPVDAWTLPPPSSPRPQPPPKPEYLDARVLSIFNMPSNLLEFEILVSSELYVKKGWIGKFIDDTKKVIRDSDFTVIAMPKQHIARCRVNRFVPSLPSGFVRLYVR